jgi:hypothetical protein
MKVETPLFRKQQQIVVVNDYLQYVLANLDEWGLGPDFPEFLFVNNAFIAGDFMGLLCGYPRNDFMVIYARHRSLESASRFVHTLQNAGFEPDSQNSFRNHQNRTIVVVPTDTTPEDVIFEFDLINLHMWFNGQQVLATENCIEHNESGSLGFWFLQSRTIMDRDWQQWNHAIEHAMLYEPRLQFSLKYPEQDNLKLFRTIWDSDRDCNSILKDTLNWNRRVAESKITTLPMFLMTVKSESARKIRDVQIVVTEPRLTESWRIFYEKIDHKSSFIFGFGICPQLWNLDYFLLDDTKVPVRHLSHQTEFETKVLQSELPVVCEDVVNLESNADLMRFLHQSLNNIVFLFPLKHGNFGAQCFNRQFLDNAHSFVECLKRGERYATNDELYWRLELAFPLLVSDANFKSLTRSTSQHFLVVETPRQFLTTAYPYSAHSSYHCNENSEQRLYVIYPVSSAEDDPLIFIESEPEEVD